MTTKSEHQEKNSTAAGEQKKPCCKGNKSSKICKATDLPMYGNPYPPKDVIRESSILEENIRKVREVIQPNFKFLEGSVDRSKQFVNTAISHTKSTVDTLRDEKNDIVKAAAITSGGLFGLLLSVRKGFFKKMMYTAIGVGSASSICYPKKAYEVIEVSSYIVKNKGPVLIKEYTGFDIETIIPARKSKNTSDEKAASVLQTANVAKDRDQSSPIDKDMLVNRSTK